MKGAFDEVLNFPPLMNCKISLLDQLTSKNHITETIRPNELESFRKPQHEMNPAIGYPMFASKHLLLKNESTYVVEDTLFIRSEIEERQDFCESEELVQ